MKKIRIAINGFGRIGRCIARALVEEQMEGRLLNIELIAINGPAPLAQHAHLLSFDSVHGKFKGEVLEGEKALIINGKKVALFGEKEVANLPWKSLEIDVVMECTGLFTSKEKAGFHIQSGAKKVIISAPAKEKDVKTIIYGVNSDKITQEDEIISIGSCTTNCLAPIAKVLNDNFKISKGFMTTIHSYTGDQNILDASHKGDLRRARAAAISMVPTSTGAAKALGLVLPELIGKLDGSSIRVPTPNVSVVDLCVLLEKQVTIESINEAFKKASENKMKGVLGIETRPLVSCDFNHNPFSSTVDFLETKVTDGNFARVLSWYDNEWGFSLRMLEVCNLLLQDQ